MEDERLMQDIQREYLDFLDDEEDQGIYSTNIRTMVAEKSRRLIVNINDLRKKNPARTNNLLQNGFQEQLAFCRAVREYVMSNHPGQDQKSSEDYFIGFEGSFGARHVTPRSLTSKFLGNLVCVEGIVTKLSLVRPKVVRSVHYCPATKKVIERKYADLTSMDATPTSSVYPKQDEDGNLLETEFGLSVYKDHQTLYIQEMPEKAPPGQLPRSVHVICDDDLVDRVKPGDRIQVVGNYRCLPGKQGGYTSGVFRTVLIANNLSQLNKEANLNITRDEITMCKKLAKNNDIFDLLAKSIAPSIHGHEYAKKAILCLLLGGIEKNLVNGTRLRGDINILLIGDPSVAKSQLLRYVLQTAPRAIPTTGRGSSGVGLTAAVTSDSETGERRLEAGAMVLADRGVVCIDEFDKMSDIDRTAIHEVMEQGKVTISKAGIHASLNARCSVLAAANPVFGRYDQYKTPMENIALQDSLLSRFDLLFVMLDTVDSDQDRMIADHVVRMHRYRKPGEQDGEVLPMGGNYADMLTTINARREENKDAPVYEKYDALLHGKSRRVDDKILSVEFIRKYINIAKCLKPKLTEAACEVIANEYSRLRSQDMMDTNVARTQPITPRTLETLIRLATSHAKARMAKTVAVQDANAAIELVQYAYFKKVLEKEKKKRRRNSGSSSEEEEGMEEEGEMGTGAQSQSQSQSQSSRKAAKRTRTTAPVATAADMDSDLEDMAEQMNQEDEGDLTRRVSRRSIAATAPAAAVEAVADVEMEETVSSEKLKVFKATLNKAFRDNRTQSLSLERVQTFVEKEAAERFTNGEINAAIKQMTDDNQVMMADGIVFLI